MPRLLSIQVGLPRTHGTEGAADPHDRPWTTAFYKEPVPGPVALGALGLAGDGVADPRFHGGPDKAVLAYSADHYPFWRELLGHALPFGAFGENLTLAGQTEADVCIGDVYALGAVRVQVTQPRQPCWKLARRWRRSDLATLVQENGRTGWYFRVLAEGPVTEERDWGLVERPYPQWTIAEANRIMHHAPGDRAAAGALAACPALSESWKRTLSARAERDAQPDAHARLEGPAAP